MQYDIQREKPITFVVTPASLCGGEIWQRDTRDTMCGGDAKKGIVGSHFIVTPASLYMENSGIGMPGILSGDDYERDCWITFHRSPHIPMWGMIRAWGCPGYYVGKDPGIPMPGIQAEGRFMFGEN